MNLLSVLFSLALLCSFKFNPMSQSLDLSNKSKSSQFIVENDTSNKMAIELTVKERKMSIDGKEELPDTKDISIFPPQIIIPPKEKRTIRVLWNGSKDIPIEKSYRVIAEQLPLDVSNTKKGTGIQMLMKYMAAFYVTPENAASKLSLHIHDIKGDTLSLKVTNSGNRHQILYQPKITFKKGQEKWVLSGKEVAGFSGENVLAKSERIFKLKTNKKIPTDAEVSLKLEE